MPLPTAQFRNSFINYVITRRLYAPVLGVCVIVATRAKFSIMWERERQRIEDTIAMEKNPLSNENLQHA